MEQLLGGGEEGATSITLLEDQPGLPPSSDTRNAVVIAPRMLEMTFPSLGAMPTRSAVAGH